MFSFYYTLHLNGIRRVNMDAIFFIYMEGIAGFGATHTKNFIFFYANNY